MTDTPKTLQEECYGTCWAACERIEELESQLRAASNRINQLEKAGDELLEWLTIDGVSLSNQRLLANQWYRAKGVKK